MSTTPNLIIGTHDVVPGEGSLVPFRGGISKEVLCSDANPVYFDIVRRGNVFSACHSAAQALSLNSATATGIILTNPAGSPKALVLLELCIAITTAPAGAATLILTGSNLPSAAAVTHTTPLTVRNTYLGSGNATANGLVDSAATIPAAPTIFRAIGGGPVATGTISSGYIREMYQGLIHLAPGTVVSLQCLTTAISVVASMTWAEIPV